MSDHMLQAFASFDRAPEIVTERLRLRPHRFGDFAAIEAMFRTERSKYMGGPLPRAKVWEMFSDSVGQWQLIGMGTWAIDRLSDGVTVGEVSICRPAHFPEPEMGWFLFEGFDGQGYATEAAQAALTFAAETYHLTSLVSYIDPDNRPSIALAERLGALRDDRAATPNGDACLVYRHRFEEEF